MRNAGRLQLGALCVLVAVSLGSCVEYEQESPLDASLEVTGIDTEASPAGSSYAIVANAPPAPACEVSGKALYVVEDAGNLNAGDAAALARLKALGLVVTTRSDEQLVAGDATGKQLIVISSTVGSTVVGPIFRNTPIPLVTWEHALYDQLGLTGGGSNDNGSTGGQSRITMVDALHPLAVGLSGLLRILPGSGIVRWGRAGGGAHVVATMAGDPQRAAVLFADTGAALVGGGHAPARRVGLFLDDASNHELTPAAWLLFDSSVVWALGNGTPAARAWLVVGAGDLTAADDALRDRMTDLGFAVSIVRHNELASTRLSGVVLVVIAESVESDVIGDFFAGLPVPVVITEDNQAPRLDMADTHGRTGGQTHVEIVKPSSPLAAGLSGDVKVYNSSSEIMWAEPGPAATIVARSKTSPARPAIFGYEAGASMVGRTAPARRLSLFHYRGNNLTTAGRQLFEAGVSWASPSRASDVCPGEVGSCEQLVLVAARTFNPSGFIDDVRELATPFSFWIPPVVPVTLGNAGDHRVNLWFGDSAAGPLTRCSYEGSGTEATPTTPEQIARADRYDFDPGVAGNCGGLVPGSVVSARYLRLRVENGGNSNLTNGKTEVTLALAGPKAGSDATCNGVDDDCDGDADDDFVTSPTSCGVGACSATGAIDCVDGSVVNTCTPGTPGSGDASCNGIDNDCDGAIDEGYVPVPTTCGIGACRRTGTTSCVNGVVQNSCTPGTPAASDATCNGIDDNCNGVVDEGYVPQPTSCGVGACSATGVTSCVAGTVQNSCTPGTPAANDALCNNVDDDCSGAVDEDYAPQPTSCGVGACHATGATSCVAGTVQNSCTPGAPAANDVSCNGVDDDCSGAVDEDYAPQPTSCGVGACHATGATSCVAGTVQNSCTPGVPAANDASCNNVDDDCSGAVDEDYAPQPTSCGVGACYDTGETSCVAGTVQNSCTPGVPAANDASCNNIDDDCSGVVDEDYAPQPTSCGVGACHATGATSCVAGTVQNSCTPGTPAANDASCNNIDDDCSGAVDEDYAPQPTSCGVGACHDTGETSCVAGTVQNSCTPGVPAANDVSCNGVDDDCSGAVDEDYAPVPTSCGVGACHDTGETSCVAGVIQNSCTPGTPAANDALCNNIDDDCSGAVDEDYAPQPTSCGVGACHDTGETSCVAGTVQNSCTPGTPAANDASCNNIDDDCSGAVDEDYAPQPTSCGVGACHDTGETSCVAGTVQNSCTPGTPAANDASCNNIDDDCSGAVDEDYAPQPTSCGVGACYDTGETSCVAGTVQNSCTPGMPAANDASCNNIDDDCSGAVDEDYVTLPTSCGVGACHDTGETSCVAGTVQSSCTPGTPAANDASCNNIDDDCSGAVDEDYAPVPTSCGVGACHATGATSCVAGTVQNSCTPGTPAANDASCNNIDDDCSGAVDEDYAPQPTSCGVGACYDTGETSCVAGVIQSSCTPGTPAANDASCNNIDDDCSGAVDEDYAPLPTSCGVGACADTGETSCVAGVIQNSCTPGTPAANDASCNNIDDDCSGVADEDFVSSPTSCGTGACEATGATSCVGGVIVDSCSPETPPQVAQNIFADVVPAIGNWDDNSAVELGVKFRSSADGFVRAVRFYRGAVNAQGYVVSLWTSDGQLLATQTTAAASHPLGWQVVTLPAPVAVTAGTTYVASYFTSGGHYAAEHFGLLNDHVSGDLVALAGGPAGGNGVYRYGASSGFPTSSFVSSNYFVDVEFTRAGSGAGDASCDGVDDDCDGQIDEDYLPLATACGEGACADTGVTSCVAGVVLDSCSAGTPADDDASCDGIDDDCDGELDEDFGLQVTVCGVGACTATGRLTCVNGQTTDDCTPADPASSDATCDGIDDDCNGQVDEDYLALPTSCGVGSCQATGVTSCVGGAVQSTCTPGTPAGSDTTCNNLDENCNGTADEGYAPLPTSCGVGACQATGATSCVGGVVQNSCTPGTPAGGDATCNNVDENCNGTADEGYVALATSCGVGACADTGATSCVAGAVLDSCSPGLPAPADYTCNGVDDDCDSEADEDFPVQVTVCGVGACTATGRLTCVNGLPSDDCTPSDPALNDALCNGVDDDCNGAVDEDYAALPTSCGVGACHASGATSCLAGVVVDSCTAGTPAPSDASCNAIDDDCSGQTDEDYLALPTSCGVGACADTGLTSCVAGAVHDSCTPGTPALADATCDGVDDNCNYEVDEDFPVQVTTCGEGACTATGRLTCPDGAPVNDCTPSEPALDDGLCNGIDDDCNGQTDEDYAPLPTSCGVGACADTGLTSCVGGGVVDSCSPGTPAPADASCDAVDDDCNGLVDDGYLPTPTSCGLGVCARAGQLVCLGGLQLDSCQPGTGAPADTLCNALDDDCNGQVDEDYVPLPTSCGVGACVSSGTTSCAAGSVHDSCAPGTPALGERCDGIDNNCNGTTDEPDGTLRWSRALGTSPSARWGAALAVGDLDGTLLLHGGRRAVGGLSTETWAWDGTGWTLLTSIGPSRRVDHAMSYDSARNVVVLFGGLVDNFADGETWEWNGVWTRVATGGPPARYAHAMAYDPVRDVTVLFGGRDGVGRKNDTWEWNGHTRTWTARGSGGPSARKGHAMVYDESSGALTLVGGFDGLVRADRWDWDGLAWHQRSSDGLPAREEHALAYDEARGRVVLFGGIGSFTTLLGDTRKLIGGAWEAIVATGPGPSARLLHVMGYDVVNQASLVFGGSIDAVGTPSAETWLLGEGCFTP